MSILDELEGKSEQAVGSDPVSLLDSVATKKEEKSSDAVPEPKPQPDPMVVAGVINALKTTSERTAGITKVTIDITDLREPKVDFEGEWDGRLRQAARALLDSGYNRYMKEKRQNLIGGFNNEA